MEADNKGHGSELFTRISQLTKKQLVYTLVNIVEKCGKDAETVLRQQLDSSSALETKAVEKASRPLVSEDSSSLTARFNPNRYRRRQIALQVQYNGSAYLGFASQDCENTVENHIFQALAKLKLIEDPKSCNYSRCGRTDKGVSALCQIISVTVRSSLPKDDQSTSTSSITQDSYEAPRLTTATTRGASTLDGEMDYITMINRSLPDDIRILGWCPVTPEFSARFSASFRKYRYFFLKKRRNLSKMRQAAGYLVGEHDFRNFCKIDIGNVSNFRREVFSAEIKCFHRAGGGEDGYGAYAPCSATGSGDTHNYYNDEEDVYMLELKGIAFLWHMVRCIMATLFMVGDGLEAPEIVTQMLDVVKTCPSKPVYMMAAEQPLVLHECGFDRLHIKQLPRHLWHLTAHYRMVLEDHLLAAARARNALLWAMEQEVSESDVQVLLKSLLDQQEKTRKRHIQRGIKSTTSHSSSSSSSSSSLCASTQKEAEEVFVTATSTSSTLLKRKYDSVDMQGHVVVACNSTSNVMGDSSGDGNKINSDPGHCSKDSSNEQSQIQDTAQAVEGSKTTSTWSDVIRKFEHVHGFTPQVKYIPYVPMMERQREGTYEERVKRLSGHKKDRLDRHLTLSESATAAGTTPEFFAHMRSQGSL